MTAAVVVNRLCRNLAAGLVVWAVAILIPLLAVTTARATTDPERRVALVVGNSAYRAVPALNNPRNDAADIAATLRQNGFEVIEGIDLDRRGMDTALGQFARASTDADVALFFYAGHGLQYRGENFLVPVDGAPADEFAIPYETTRVADVVEALSRARIRLLVLDACRNNPLAEKISKSTRTRSFEVSRGLARISQSQGMLIAYATQANDVATDGVGRNSPFSAALVQQMALPGLEIGQLFRRVAAIVNSRTKGHQTPELSISLLGDFYLNRSETDLQAWAKIRDRRDGAALTDFIRRYPDSMLVDAARAQIDSIERTAKADALSARLARVEDERAKAAAEIQAQRQEEADRAARADRDRERLAALQAEARRRQEEQAERIRRDEQEKLNRRLAELEGQYRQAQSTLADQAKAAEKEATTQADRDRQRTERERLATEQLEHLRREQVAASARKEQEDRVVAERLARSEEADRAAKGELEARLRGEAADLETRLRDRDRLVAELETERRRATGELQALRQELAAGRQAAPAKVAALPPSPEVATPPDLFPAIRQELERVACLRAKPEDAWSTASVVEAVRRSARIASIEVPLAPSEGFLGVLKQQPSGTCPGALRPPRRVAPRPRVVERASPKPVSASRSSAKPARAGGRPGCFSFNGRSFCE